MRWEHVFQYVERIQINRQNEYDKVMLWMQKKKRIIVYFNSVFFFTLTVI